MPTIISFEIILGGEPLVTINSDSDINLINNKLTIISRKKLVNHAKFIKHRLNVLLSCFKHNFISLLGLQDDSCTLRANALCVSSSHSRLNLPIKICETLALTAKCWISHCLQKLRRFLFPKQQYCLLRVFTCLNSSLKISIDTFFTQVLFKKFCDYLHSIHNKLIKLIGCCGLRIEKVRVEKF